MNEVYDKLIEKGLDMTYCEFEDLMLHNAEDVINCLQVGGRPEEREKRDC